jgi:hypothetical protein
MAVEEARLTEEAVTSKSAAFAAALPEALAISQALTTTNAAQQLTALAATYNTSLPGLPTIAAEYGFAIPTSIIDSTPAVPPAANAQVQAYLEALAGATAPANTAGANVAGSAKKGFGSLDFSPEGSGALQQYINGLTDNNTNKGIKAAAIGAVGDAKTAASSAGTTTPSWAGIGGNFTTGMATGMLASGPLTILQNAAAQAVGKAKDAANTKAISSSPSKLFADEVGTWLTQGIAAGMTDRAALLSLRTTLTRSFNR